LTLFLNANRTSTSLENAMEKNNMSETTETVSDQSSPPILTIDGPRATIRLNRPQKLNRLSQLDLDTLTELFDRIEADRAIAYDGGGPEGYWMRGVISLYQRDFDAAAEHFATAETLGPHSADLLVQYADALSHLGSPQEGWKRFERALQLNPMPPDHYWWAGASIAFVEERYDAVIALCAKMESDLAAIRLLASTHALLGDVGVAQTYARRVKETYPGATRETISALVPSRDRESVARFMEGLRLAGVV